MTYYKNENSGLNLKMCVSIQLVKFIKELVFVEKHTLEKLFAM